MKKRQYTAEFKAKIVLEIISGEQELGTIASKHQINPNLLRKWKTAFLENAATVFETDKSSKEMLERERELEEEKETMLKTIGQLTMERDFLMRQAHERNREEIRRRC